MDVFADKGFRKADDVLIIGNQESDIFLINYARKLISNNESRISVVDYHGQIKNSTVFKEQIRSIEQTAPNHIVLLERSSMNKDFLSRTDIAIMSLGAWKFLLKLNRNGFLIFLQFW